MHALLHVMHIIILLLLLLHLFNSIGMSPFTGLEYWTEFFAFLDNLYCFYATYIVYINKQVASFMDDCNNSNGQLFTTVSYL